MKNIILQEAGNVLTKRLAKDKEPGSYYHGRKINWKLRKI